MSEKTIVTKLQLIDGYKFTVKSNIEYIPDFLVDETKPDGEGSGPSPPRLLAAAVGHCMSSSLIYCLKKARIPIKNLETTVKAKDPETLKMLDRYQNEVNMIKRNSKDHVSAFYVMQKS